MTESPSPDDDVRMRGFARRSTVAQALAWLDGHARRLGSQSAPLDQAAGRVLAEDMVSRVDVPSFVRAMMDGFAVRACDTLGASAYNRLALDVIGESLPGRPFHAKVQPGQAVRIMTGAPLPEGADAVLPAEWVEIDERMSRESRVESREPEEGRGSRVEGREPAELGRRVKAANERVWALGEVSPGKHTGGIGEDISAGTCVLRAGRVLRPQDLGVLSSIGAGQLSVVCRPRVRIVVTGNELLPTGSICGAGETPAPQSADRYKIADANGPMLAALVVRDGGGVESPGIVPDDPDAILAAMRGEGDVVLVSGGSSVGQEDHAAILLRRHGELPIHGIAMRPSSPAGMGLLDGQLVFLLPGNPVSCLTAYDFFAGRAIRILGGRPPAWPYRRIVAPLARKIVSTVGRLEYLRVRLAAGRVEPLAIGGSSILSSTTRADGFVVIPDDSEGYAAGSEVEVFLYD